MKNYTSLLANVSRYHWRVLLLTSVGFVILYYSALLLFTVVRFSEIPNYVVFHDVFHVYGLIYEGTPSWLDMIPIMLDEAWFETGYKHPDYYGIATWSYMLIPPKMTLVLFMGALVGIFAALIIYGKKSSCQMPSNKRLFAAAGVSTAFIGMTSATLTWVVCCATPSWVVALAMLGMSSSLALLLEPLGHFITFSGFILMLWIIYYQLRLLVNTSTTVAEGY